MGLELLKEADYILDACGRPVPPPGYKFVDLPRIIPYQTTVLNTGEGGISATPTLFRLTNNANTLFICKGVAINTQTGIRIKWPTGRFLNQNPSSPSGASGFIEQFPNGVAGNMLSLQWPQLIEKGGRIGIEVWNAGGVIKVEFWGVLRYLLKDTGDNLAADPNSQCIIGYPAWANKKSPSPGSFKIEMIPDPIAALEALPRYACGPNQNIMAPEFLLGDSPSVGEVPDGYIDDSFTFFSPAYTIGVGGQSFGNAVIIPGQDDVVIKRWRSFSTWSAETVGTPVLGMRLPNGYSLTGGDLIPCVFGWMPVFPTLRIPSGGRLILDVSNIDATGDTITTTFEFDAVKRRKVLNQ